MMRGPEDPGGHHYLGLRLDCGGATSRGEVADRLRRLAASVWPPRGGAVLMFALFLVTAFVLLGASLLLSALLPWMGVVPLAVGLFTLALALLALRESSRRSGPAGAIRGLALLVEMGLVAPGEVCGRSVEELVNLYERRSAGLPRDLHR